MAEDERDIRAPLKSMPFRGKGGPGGQVSFETYFLRDLFQRGLIDEGLIRELVRDNALDDTRVDDVIKILQNRSGTDMPRGLVDFVEGLASVIADRN